MNAKKSANIVCVKSDYSESIVYVAIETDKKTCSELIEEWIDLNANKTEFKNCCFRIDQRGL